MLLPIKKRLILKCVSEVGVYFCVSFGMHQDSSFRPKSLLLYFDQISNCAGKMPFTRRLRVGSYSFCVEFETGKNEYLSVF